MSLFCWSEKTKEREGKWFCWSKKTEEKESIKNGDFFFNGTFECDFVCQ